MDINYITPIEQINGIYFKRDDLFQPFTDIPLSGGKVRQCIELLKENKEYIEKECNNHICTGTGVTSPQGIIVTRVAKEFGFKTTVFVGNTNFKSLEKNILMQNIISQGGEINCESIQAYDQCLNAVIKKKIENEGNMFQVKFGINLIDNPNAILNSIGEQVQNLPKDLDYLFIPCGSCITLCGILQGLDLYNIHPKHVVGIQIAGYDRNKNIEKILNISIFNRNKYPYELWLDKDYPYNKPLKLKIGNIDLDWLYEAKAYDYLIKYHKNILENNKVCFWIVGNSIPVRSQIF